jgi:hypothetical protein
MIAIPVITADHHIVRCANPRPSFHRASCLQAFRNAKDLAHFTLQFWDGIPSVTALPGFVQGQCRDFLESLALISAIVPDGASDGGMVCRKASRNETQRQKTG